MSKPYSSRISMRTTATAVIGRRHHRRQRGQRIGADDQLEGIEGAGQRRVESGRDGARGAAAHQHPQVAATHPERPPDARGHRRRRSGYSPPPARPRRRQPLDSRSGRPRSGCRSATSARRTARSPRSDRPPGAAASARRQPGEAHQHPAAGGHQHARAGGDAAWPDSRSPGPRSNSTACITWVARSWR